MTTSRRYTGEAKFYGLFVNITDPTYGFVGEKETFLVPRSVFFDTYLYSRLNKASNMTGWLTDSANKVQFSQNDSAGPGTAALDGTLTAELDLAEYLTMTDWLKKNVSGGMAYRYFRVDWESSVGDSYFLLGLPDAIVQLASYEPLPNTPSQTYVFDYRPVWQRIWDGTIGATLGWIASGFVAAVNFMVNLPTMLAQLGAWLWSALVGAAQTVASAVQAAGKAFGQLFDAIVAFIVDALRKLMDPLLGLIQSAMQPQAFSIRDYAVSNQANFARSDPGVLTQLAEMATSGNLFNVVLALTIGIQAAWLVLVASTGGVALAMSKALDIVIGLIIGAIIGFVVTMAVDALLLGVDGFLHSLIPAGDPFWAEGAGIAISGAVVALGAYFHRGGDALLKDTDAYWLAWAVLSIPFQIAAALIPDSMAWLAVIVSGVSLIIDSIAVYKIIFEIHDLFDEFGGPFKYVEELTSVVTVAYDTTSFLQDVERL